MRTPLTSPSAEAARLCRHGQEALSLEIEGLITLKDTLGESFVNAIDTLMKTRGRIVMSGVGKSGHIGRKIAATLSSTGTPAFFLHPTEASHGDLGMVVPGDAIVILSNSGETEELLDLVCFAKHAGIPVIAITQKENSVLAKSATVVIQIPPAAEACPLQLAPTTSTTMMMALGDAIAITLLHEKGFTDEGYRALHPGGNLGRRLLRVQDIMHRGEAMPLVAEAAPMADVLMEITGKAFGCAGVLDIKGNLIGIITDGDLRRHLHEGLFSKTAGAVMTPTPKTIAAHERASDALVSMQSWKITSLFVVASPCDGKDRQQPPLGILHIHDLIRGRVVP